MISLSAVILYNIYIEVDVFLYNVDDKNSLA